MSKTVSTRLKEKELKKLEEITNEEHLDRSSLIRRFILEQIKLHEMKKVSEYYRKGIMSLQEAATEANVSIYELMDYVQKEKIRPPIQSDEEINKELEDDIDLGQKMGL